MEKDRMGLQVGLSRDPQRTPMQWSDDANAGFSSVQPNECWLPVGEDFDTLNVEAERADPKSMLNLYRALIACRRSTPALLDGTYRPVDVNTREVFAFLRERTDQRMLVALNFSDQLINLNLHRLGKGKIHLSTFLERNDPVNLARFEVYPNEGLIIELE
jgi:alpha-glucosidase